MAVVLSPTEEEHLRRMMIFVVHSVLKKQRVRHSITHAPGEALQLMVWVSLVLYVLTLGFAPMLIRLRVCGQVLEIAKNLNIRTAVEVNTTWQKKNLKK